MIEFIRIEIRNNTTDSLSSWPHTLGRFATKRKKKLIQNLNQSKLSGFEQKAKID